MNPFHILKCADGYVVADSDNECAADATVHPLTAAGLASAVAECREANEVWFNLSR